MGGGRRGGADGLKVYVSARGGDPKSVLSEGSPKCRDPKASFWGPSQEGGEGIPKVLYGGEGPQTTGCPQ